MRHGGNKEDPMLNQNGMWYIPPYLQQLNISFSGKATRSTQNRTMYRRQNGRRGSPVIPFIHPILSNLAKEPVPLTPMACLVFHTPKLVMSDPLTREAILGLSTMDSIPTKSDIIHGLYLRHERDAQDNHINQFNSGDIISLQRDIERELRVVLRAWKALWKKENLKPYNPGTEDSDESEEDIDFVHLQWIARIANGLRDELFSLGTAQRRQGYVSSITAHRPEIPHV